MAKNLARLIAEATDNGGLLLKRLFELGGLDPDNPMPANTAAERRVAVAAIEILLERGAGKATQEVQISLGEGAAATAARLRPMTEAQLEALAQLDEIDDDAGPHELGSGAIIDAEST